MIRLAYAFLFVLSTAAGARAQTPPPVPPPTPQATPPAQQPVTTGTITGKVALDTGQPVHGANVLLIGSPRTATTQEDGTYTVTGVAPGTYEVIAQREHLTTGSQPVTVAAGQTATPNLQ